jgi:hypothetical protein
MTTDAYLDQPAPSVLADLDVRRWRPRRGSRGTLVAVTLARRYARALDVCLDDLESNEAIEDAAHHARKVLEIARLGQRMEGMLDRLGMAPGARPAVPGNPNGAERDPQSSALDQLRTDAAAGAPTSGVDYAASVDPSVTEADPAD